MKRETIRAAFYYTLPFQLRALEPIAGEFEQHLISSSLQEIEQWHPTVLVTADGAALPALRTIADRIGASVVGLRHGVANKYIPVEPEYSQADYVCGSEWDKEDFRRSGVLPRKEFLLTGNPWVDGVFQIGTRTVNKENPTILFAPTYNPEVSAAFFFGDEFVRLIRAVYPKSRIIIKPHPAILDNEHPYVAEHRARFKQLITDWDQMVALDGQTEFVKDSKAPISDYFGDADILVSDGSSLVFEFMALQRPIMLYNSERKVEMWKSAYDASALANSRRDVGVEFRTKEEFVWKLTTVFDDHELHHRAIQETYAKEIFGAYTDGKSYLRCAEAIKRVLSVPSTPSAARLIAFHLPQFHPIPENDAWWGKGFTEWTNVTKAVPAFEGHYQPHVPTDLGYYDLRLPDAREAQAELARAYGIEGFCFWHYWFNGKLLLERPIAEMLQSGKPDFPFCLAWANEHWTRAWDGQEKQILMQQTYGGEADSRAHFEWLLPAFRDARAIRVEGKPLFLIYRPGTVPQVADMIAQWKRWANEAGLPGLFFMAIQSGFDSLERNWCDAGFDGQVYFHPRSLKVMEQFQTHSPQRRDAIIPYEHAWTLFAEVNRPTETDARRFASVVPSWDNTPRRPGDGFVLHDSTPDLYEQWLRTEIERVSDRDEDKRIVFVNAWNEWAESNHLEPDAKWGRGYLEATKRAAGHSERHSARAHWMRSLAGLKRDLGNIEEAERLLREACSASPDTDSYLALVRLLKGTDRVDEAAEIINALLDADSSNAAVLNEAGVMAFESGEAEQAAEFFKHAVTSRPGYLEAYKNLGDVCLVLDQPSNAIDAFKEALRCDANDVEAHLGMASALLHIDRAKNAEFHLARVLELVPGHPIATRLLDGIRVSRSSAQETPSIIEAKSRAVALRDQGNYAEANQVLQSLILEVSEDAEVWNELGVVRFHLGDPQGAVDALQQAIECDATSVTARKNLADVLMQHQQWEDAEAVLVEAEKVDPKDGEIHEALNALRLRTKKPDRIPGSKRKTDEPLPAECEQITCPLCGSEEAEVFRRSADIVKCCSCDTVYLRTRMNKQAMVRIYQSYAEDTSHLHLPVSDEEIKKTPLRREGFLDELLRFIRPEGELLDIGCGWGAFLNGARERGFQPRGIEMTRKSVEFAKTRLGINVTNDQFLDTPFDDGSLSVVTMLHVFEHLPEPWEALQKIHSILKPNGLFCGIVPNVRSLCSIKQEDQWQWLDPNYHYVHYSPETLRNHLERSGFIVEEMYTISGDYEPALVRGIARSVIGVDQPEALKAYIKELEERGFGEEIRFFARKADQTSTLLSDRKSDQGRFPAMAPKALLTVPTASEGIEASIIIPVFNQLEYTKKCIESLYAVTPESARFEVVVVDNASTDGTNRYFESAVSAYPNLRYVRNDTNLFFAKACNIGAKEAVGKYLVFLNNDTEPEAGWLEAGIARLKEANDVGIVGSKLLYPDRTVQHCGIEFYRGVNAEYEIWPLHRYLGASEWDPRANLPEQVTAVTGACIFIAKKLFKKVGGMAEEYGMYFEDTDLCFKVRIEGKRILYEPTSVVIHHESKSTGDRSVVDRMNAESAKKFYSRWSAELPKIEFNSLVEQRDRHFVQLSMDILPEGSMGTLTQELLNSGANRLARLMQTVGPFYAHFGGAGDAALLMSTFYDRDPYQTVVSVANSIPAMKSFFSAYPKLKKVIFIPFPRYGISHQLLRKLFKRLGNCRGIGATPIEDYHVEWNTTLNIFEHYGIIEHPRWSSEFKQHRIAPVQVVIQPRGSAKGMVGSKQNVIDPLAWEQLLGMFNARGIQPVVIGTPDERAEYPVTPEWAIEKRSFSFEEQMKLIGSADLFIGADSWGKSFAALCGVRTVVFHSMRGSDLEGWIDPSDMVFINPWNDIRLVESVAEIEPLLDNAFDRSYDWRGNTKKQQQFSKIHTVYIQRQFGMGDVLMALPAVRAIKESDPTARVAFITDEKYVDLVHANPFVDRVLTSVLEVKPGVNDRMFDLNPATHGIGSLHEVDSFIREVGAKATDKQKSIELRVPDEVQQCVDRLLGDEAGITVTDEDAPPLILLHPALGDPNRTWPRERWEELAGNLLAEGCRVIVTGDTGKDATRGVHKLQCPGLVSFVDRLTALQFVALCRRSDVLVSTDSGPVQLAGASDIGIVGIYSVVHGKKRLPYRHGKPMWNAIAVEPECSNAGCYSLLNEPKMFDDARRRIDRGELTAAELFSSWCAASEQFACMKQQITVEAVQQGVFGLIGATSVNLNEPVLS